MRASAFRYLDERCERGITPDRYIETREPGGKRSEAHRAAVLGDTASDPFKDAAGQSLHVLIKLLSTITLVPAPLFI